MNEFYLLIIATFIFAAASCESVPQTEGPARESQRAVDEPICDCFRQQTCAKGICRGIGLLSVAELAGATGQKDFLLIKLISEDAPLAGMMPGTDTAISAGHVGRLAETIGADPRRKVVLYGRNTAQALGAAQALAEHGYDNVSILDGDFLAWQASEAGPPEDGTGQGRVPMIHYEVEALQLGLDLFADLSALTLRQDGALTYLVQDSGALRIVLWAGPDQNLASWRERLNVRGEATFTAETDTQVSGVPGRQQSAAVRHAETRGAFPSPNGNISHLTTEAFTSLHTCVAFSHAEHNVLTCWIVDEAARALYADEASRFFASISLHPSAPLD